MCGTSRKRHQNHRYRQRLNYHKHRRHHHRCWRFRWLRYRQHLRQHRLLPFHLLHRFLLLLHHRRHRHND